MSATSPAVTVIIPAYGVAHLLGEALASLQAQSFADWEAVVIDDGAPDDVAGAIAPFLEDARIRFLQTDNGGIAVARARAIAAARAPLIALLDGDDVYEPDYLARMIPAIEADPKLGFVTCDARYTGMPDREGDLFSRHSPQALPITLARVLDRRFNVFIGCVIRKQAYDAIGGFDGALRSAEDLDLWFRLLGAGWQGGYVIAPLVGYRRRADSLSANTISLLRWTERVYEKAAAMLRAQPEAAIARTMTEITRRKIAWHEGETLIREGHARDGVAMLSLAGADERSLRWRIAMPLMRRAPWLAPSLISLRLWLPQLFPGGSEW